MADIKDVPDLVPTIFTLAADISQIFIPQIFPTNLWRNDSMLGRVTTAAKSLTKGIGIFPRHSPIDVLLVMDLENSAVRGAFATADARPTVELD